MLAIIGAWHISRLLLVLYLLAYHLGGLYNVEMLWFRRPLIDIYVVSMVLSLNMLILHYSRHPMIILNGINDLETYIAASAHSAVSVSHIGINIHFIWIFVIYRIS